MKQWIVILIALLLILRVRWKMGEEPQLSQSPQYSTTQSPESVVLADSSGDLSGGVFSRFVHPVGTIVMYLGSVPPDGWLLCDGQTSLQGYPELAQFLAQNGMNNTTTPDLRQRSPIGYDRDNTTYDQLGDSLGVAEQPYKLLEHQHLLNWSSDMHKGTGGYIEFGVLSRTATLFDADAAGEVLDVPKNNTGELYTVRLRSHSSSLKNTYVDNAVSVEGKYDLSGQYDADDFVPVNADRDFSVVHPSLIVNYIIKY